jgi:hypothetical protein
LEKFRRADGKGQTSSNSSRLRRSQMQIGALYSYALHFNATTSSAQAPKPDALESEVHVGPKGANNKRVPHADAQSNLSKYI